MWIVLYGFVITGPGDAKIKQIMVDVIDKDLVAINSIIIVEVLSGISRKKEFEKVRGDFKGFHILLCKMKFF